MYAGREYSRAITWNRDAAGGPNWVPGPFQGLYGLAVDVQKVASMYAPQVLDEYALGARLERFPRPGYQFLAIESEGADDVSSAIGPYYDLVSVPTGDLTIPPYSCMGGNYAFRHVLPRATGQYQTQATACSLFVDGHVGIVRPTDMINTLDRFVIE
jgi:hypothetical protein